MGKRNCSSLIPACVADPVRDTNCLSVYPAAAAAAAASLQSCSTLCDPIDGSPPGSPISGILQARTLEWVAISFSHAWKWKVKAKSLSRVWLLTTPWTAATRLLHPWDFPGKSTGVGYHRLLWFILLRAAIVLLFTLSVLFTEPTVGKAPAKRLEEGTGSHRNCRHIYSLLSGATALQQT